ncbi:carbon storage regulator CsrA [Pontibacillus yanchengensis]|uniref:Translational regulator CsrA n=1 Tax=Pontibacillus yanchengensis TaxID=462910 RepID=A0A6I4ZXV1_9BACI|nr:carbon storage regulator CsrA [Pontibacillus yanchengensis]MYL33974.1 carbon storage regulator CsrA [Pontibacillus yanchengensis]
MLILNRKLNDSIQIGDDIEIKVISIDGDQVKIGIDAPKSVDVYRKELYIKIQEENQEASNTTNDLLDLLKKPNKD